jgi:hypothetical protein
MANENTVSIEFTADGNAAIAGSTAVETGVNASVDRMNKGSKDSAAAQGKVWEQATQDRITQILRLQNENNQAVQRMAGEWNAYKSAGVSATTEVSSAMTSGLSPVDQMVGKLRVMAAEALAAYGGFKLLQTAKDSTMFAANVEQATRALDVLGNRTGHTAAEVEKWRDKLRDMNITTMAATGAVARFTQAQLPLEKLPMLASMAQGAAIMSSLGKETVSSSEAFKIMVDSLITGQTVTMHQLGLDVSRIEAMHQMRAEMGLGTKAYDQHAMRVQELGLLLEHNAAITTLYANSQDLASKKISSSQRPIEELSLALGQLFLPELTVGATVFYDAVSGGMKIVKAHTAEMEAAKAMIKDLSVGLLYGVGALAAYSSAVTLAALVTGGLATGAGIFSGVLPLLVSELSLTGAEAVTTSIKIGMFGESIVTASARATVGLMSIKTAMGVLGAFMIGWEIGKTLNAQFQSVRDFGTEVVWGLAVAWRSLVDIWKVGAAVVGNMFNPTAMQAALDQVEQERIAWDKTWAETRAQQLADNAKDASAVVIPAAYVNDKAAIAQGLADQKERLRKEQEMRDQAALVAAEKERKRQAEISQIIAEIRERDLLIGKDKDQKELIQLDLKQLKETNALKAHHATQVQLDEAAGLQHRVRADMLAQQSLDKKKAEAAAAAEIARKSFEEQAAWLQKLDDFQLKTGQISDTTALSNKFNRERELLELKQKEIDGQIALETHEKKRLELVGQRLTLQNQINHSYVEEGQQLALNAVKEESLLFAHQQRMKEITQAGVEARLHFLGQEQGALTAHYAWKREQLNAQYAEDMQSLTLSQAQKLEKERQYQQQSLQLEQERAQKQADLWFSNAQKYGGVMQQMTTMGVQLLLADESQRSQIGKRMLATSIRFGAQELQQFMFNKGKEHLLAAASEAGKITTAATSAVTQMSILDTLAWAWCSFYTAQTLNPIGGELYEPAAIAMGAVAGGTTAAIAAIAAEGGAGVAGELALGGAWIAGGVLVGALGEGVASSIEGNGSSRSTGTTSAVADSNSTSSTTTATAVTTQAPAAAPPVIVNIHIMGNVVDHDQFAREMVPSIRRAISDGMR